MRYLLDVNVLVAWAWPDHTDHGRVANWLAEAKRRRSTRLLTSAIPEVGFVRVSVQRSAGRLTPNEAGAVLAGMLAALAPHHEFLPDDLTAVDWPDWCRGARQTTDAHLVALAARHGASLATLDTSIPGAFLLPSPSSIP